MVTFFITDKEVEDLLQVSSRELPMPDGSIRVFEGSNLMWKALDFLVVCGKWSRWELVDISVRSHAQSDICITGLLPKGHGQPGTNSRMELRMLEAPRIDPAMLRPSAGRPRGQLPCLNECLHDTVAALYRSLQERLGSAGDGR